MSEAIETPAVETPKAAKATKAKKPAKADKPSANGEKVLGTPQVRILKALTKLGRATRAQINAQCAKAGFETAKKFSAWMADPLGQNDPKSRKAAEAKSGRKSLLTLGFVKMIELPKPDTDSGATETWFEATAAGRKALAKAE